MKYYTWLMETYDGEKVEITVKADSEEEADRRLGDYHVNKGELKYKLKLLSVSETGTERYYSKPNNGIALAIALMGAAMGKDVTAQYMSRDKRNYLDCLKDKEVLYLLGKERENA